MSDTPKDLIVLQLEPPPQESWDSKMRLILDYERFGVSVPENLTSFPIPLINDSVSTQPSRSVTPMKAGVDFIRSPRDSFLSAAPKSATVLAGSTQPGSSTRAPKPAKVTRVMLEPHDPVGQLFKVCLVSPQPREEDPGYEEVLELGFDTRSPDTWVYGQGYALLRNNSVTDELEYAEIPAGTKFLHNGVVTGWDENEGNHGVRIFVICSSSKVPFKLRTQPNTAGLREVSGSFDWQIAVAVAAPRMTLRKPYDGILGMAVPTSNWSHLDPPLKKFVPALEEAKLLNNNTERYYVRLIPGCGNPLGKEIWMIRLLSIKFVSNHGGQFLPEEKTFVDTDGKAGIAVLIDSGTSYSWLPGTVEWLEKLLPRLDFLSGESSYGIGPPLNMNDVSVMFTFKGREGADDVQISCSSIRFLTGGHKAGSMSAFSYGRDRAIPEGYQECLLREAGEVSEAGGIKIPAILGQNFLQCFMSEFNFPHGLGEPSMRFVEQRTPGAWTIPAVPV
ncbi:hypothetical protein EVG20_g11078 [Dentipellis fragilis]|uniref:Uncharacterized protein n=1 Tax=Dentipellis fragilis TaxID=205917 RepID=A0A4Y9XNE2_9AGAM|nr:hypothetical protein EVG20_g11078 [Dentipellis fragilis]